MKVLLLTAVVLTTYASCARAQKHPAAAARPQPEAAHQEAQKESRPKEARQEGASMGMGMGMPGAGFGGPMQQQFFGQHNEGPGFPKAGRQQGHFEARQQQGGMPVPSFGGDVAGMFNPYRAARQAHQPMAQFGGMSQFGGMPQMFPHFNPQYNPMAARQMMPAGGPMFNMPNPGAFNQFQRPMF